MSWQDVARKCRMLTVWSQLDLQWALNKKWSFKHSRFVREKCQSFAYSRRNFLLGFYIGMIMEWVTSELIGQGGIERFVEYRGC